MASDGYLYPPNDVCLPPSFLSSPSTFRTRNCSRSQPLQLHLRSILCLLQLIVKLLFSPFWQLHHTCPTFRAVQLPRQAQWRPNRIRWIGSTTRRPRFYFSRANLSPALLIDETIRSLQRIGCSKQAVQVSPALVHMIQVPPTLNLLPLDRPPLPSRTATTYKYRRKQIRAR